MKSWRNKMEVLDMIYEMSCIFVPCMIYGKIASKRVQKVSIKHVVLVVMFVFYVYLCLDVAGIGTVWQIGRYKTIIGMDEINWIPFSSDGVLTYILNIVMFMPLGFLLPLIWKNMRKCSNVFWTSFGFSFAIEFCQLFNFRVTDMDDLMMNTLGGMFGFLVWKLFAKISKIDLESDKAITPKEPIFYLLFAVLGKFFLYDGLGFVTFLEKMGL